MSEQQRVFLAVALCLGIMLLWPLLSPPEEPAPAPPQSPAPATSAIPATPPTPGTPPATPAPAAPPTGDVAPSGEVAPAAIEAPVEVSRPFATPLYRGALSNVDASLTALELLRYNEPLADGESAAKDAPRRPVSLVTAEHGGVRRQALLSWQLGDAPATPINLVWRDADGFALQGYAPTGQRVSVEVAPRQDAYALDYVLRVVNEASSPIAAGATVTLSLDPGPKRESSWFAPPTNLVQGVCASSEELERKLDTDIKEDGPFTLPSAATWGAIDRQYFVVAAWANGQPLGCTMNVVGDALQVQLSFTAEALAPGATWERKLSLFLGPKRDDTLAAVAGELKEVIDYVTLGIPLGFLARPMVALLSVFHGWTSSWGLAILLLTLVVKVLLFPVTFKSSISMRKMQLLKPDLDRIKKQFEGDRERQQLEQMKLFKEKGVNPLGGCLPMLLQMPVWFALYRTLWSAVDLYQQPFLWLPDLTAKEPLPIMALVIGGLTYLQQKLMPTAADSQQAKMMLYMMPVMLTVFMIALPSGLVLYILFNSVLTLFQQLAINKRLTSLG